MFALAVLLTAVHARAAIALKQVAEGFVSPLNLVSLPGSGGELLIGDQVGTIHVLNKQGRLEEKLFLDVRERTTKLRNNFDERGLLGLVLHPQFKKNRKFYVYYSAPLRPSAPKDWDHTGQLSEFTVKAGDPHQADASSERVVIQIDEPQFNHNGGRIAFGPDGFLYIAIGDGGGQRDSAENHGPTGNGQNKDVLLGKILRIDVDKKDAGREYGVPRDNPFAKGGGRPEIFSYGHRNPWGVSFDRGGRHELFEAEVGENMWEEINVIRRGGNYGWRLREGPAAFDPANPLKPPEETPRKAADGTLLVEPIAFYKNAKGHPGDPDLKGTSVTGGYVYRGKAIRELQGRYVFADWSRNWGVADGILLVATAPKSKQETSWKVEALEVAGREKGQLLGYVVALGEDGDGELYALTTMRNALSGNTGKVYKLVPAK
ncbi:MAG TPA: PQQ-dependent sugar dehydrogenase [Verrucomicrobiae bacterium]|jgi:glucose/arabinose dehydrogenase